MKKALFTIVALALCVGCAKESNPGSETPQKPETAVASAPVNINFEIASPGDDAPTKAVKQGWASGDRVYIWFADVMASVFVIRDCDLILTYNGSAWKQEYQVAGLADWLVAKKTTANPYFIDKNENGTYDEGVDESRTAYYAPVYAIWVDGNDLLDNSNGWKRYDGHAYDGHNYLFTMPACLGKPENKSPMMLTSGFYAADYYSEGMYIDYEYTVETNSLDLVKPNNIDQKTQLTWKFYTNFQVTVTGLEAGKVYKLSSPQFGSNNIYVSNSENGRGQLIRMINAATSAGHFGLWETSTANADGEAYFFGQATTVATEQDFTFVLKDENNVEYTCVKENKTVTASDTKLSAIKLKFYDFNHWTVVGAFNDWGSTPGEPIIMKRISTPDYNADPRNGNWEADIIGYKAGQAFKLSFNNNWNQGNVGMKEGWENYGLGDWENNENYLTSDNPQNIYIKGSEDGDYHLFFSYPSHWFVITKK